MLIKEILIFHGGGEKRTGFSVKHLGIFLERYAKIIFLNSLHLNLHIGSGHDGGIGINAYLACITKTKITTNYKKKKKKKQNCQKIKLH